MSASDHKLVNQENKSAADIITWREFEALRNEMRREFRAQDDVLNGKVEEINQKLDATNETVTAMADQVTDIQRTLRTLSMNVENLTNQQRQQNEDADEALGRGDRPRGWAPLGRNGRGQDEEDGLGHFKRDCPNRKVMIINEDNEYETGDDVDPNALEDDDYDTDGEDAYPSDARTIVVSQRALNVLPSASTQHCNLFQTNALVGPDKACKQAGEIDNLTVSLGQSTLVVLCRFHVGAGIPGVAPHYIPPPSTFDVLLDSYRFHVGAGIPGVAPHYIPPPSTFDVLLDSYWFDKPWFLTEGNLLLYASHLPLGVPNERVLYVAVAAL
ncbi:hypothetical protein QYE76_062398 [Lolium multiflorum]|uniref:Uncharacterized protein n=1 Tax=Lolium multiflorum TaxID=4521 RepID=A0AAD8S4E8_LOLMU|nr:hypothetical protein QYE76_062398 [Lolium multiflorum]